MIRADLDRYRDPFQRDGIVVVPQIFEAALIATVEATFTSEFRLNTYDELNWTEFALADDHLNRRLHFIFNSDNVKEPFARFLGRPVGFVSVRVYYHDEETSGQNWHDDRHDPQLRFAALRVELSRDGYAGGAFQFEDRQTKKLTTVPQLPFGDGVLFQVSTGPHFHMVEKVSAGVRRSLILFFCANS